MECCYCKKIFKTTSSLNHHQKSTKYCLEIQGAKKELYTCIHCNESFSVKSALERHLNSCKTKKNAVLTTINNELEETKQELITLKEQIKTMKSNFQKNIKEKDIVIDYQKIQIEKLEKTNSDLQNTIEKLATHAISRPTTSTTKNTQINYIQQMKPVIDDELKDNAQNLTIDHILKGPEGYAQYALEYPLKDRVCCVDYARRKVKFKDPNGNVITDPEMSTLATKFFQSIKDKNKDLIIEYGTKLNEHLGEHLDDLIEILDIKSGVDNGADGSKTEFYHDFVKNICGKTIVE